MSTALNQETIKSTEAETRQFFQMLVMAKELKSCLPLLEIE